MADEIQKKPHYFEVVMNSCSEVNGQKVLNQEVIVREYANTPAELTAKQMPFSMEAIPAMLGAFDTMSKPLQEQGVVEMAEAFEEEVAARKAAKAKGPKKK